MEPVQTSLPFTGDPSKALEVAKTILLSNNFSVEQAGENLLSASGPGIFKAPPLSLFNIETISIKAHPHKLEANYRLGSPQKFRRNISIVMLFTFLVSTAFSIVDQTSRHSLLPIWAAIPFPFIAIFPWILVIRLALQSIQKNTMASVNQLLQNMSTNAL